MNAEKNLAKNRKRKLAETEDNFSLWLTVPGETKYEFMRFLDARNVQRLKLVSQTLINFVDFHEEHWPGNKFTSMKMV